MVPAPNSTTAFNICAHNIQQTRSKISATCVRWRQVVINLEVLWRMVSIGEVPTTIDSTSCSEFDHPLSAVLSRLNALHLVRAEISVAPMSCTRKDQEYMDAVLALAITKAQYLSYGVHNFTTSPSNDPLLRGPPVQLPYLEKLSVLTSDITSPFLNLAVAPLLRDLWIHNSLLDHPLQIKLPPSSQMRYMSLSGSILPSSVIEALQSCPNIQTLMLRVTPNPSIAALAHAIHLPSLRNLSLWDVDDYSFNSFPLGLLDCPQLECLELAFHGADFNGPVNFSNIRCLAIYCASWRGPFNYLESLFTSLSTVKRLAFTHNRVFGDDGRDSPDQWLGRTLQSPDILPELELIETAAAPDDLPGILNARPESAAILPKPGLYAGLDYSGCLAVYKARMKFVERHEFPTIGRVWANWKDMPEEWY